MKEDKGKILGVLGGMGPLASQLFYKMIIENTKASSDQEHLNMIILNHATMPDRTEAIMNGTVDQILDKLICDIEYLESGGAEYVAIPCNTSHTIIDKLQESVDLKIINMVEATVDHIAEASEALAKYQKIKVGIMATDGTVKTKLYQDACNDAGLEPVVPSAEVQKLVMKIIYDGIKFGGEIDYADFQTVEDEMRKTGCQCVILACTELSCFKEMYKLPGYYIDAMEVLAKRAITLCGKELKKK